MKKVLYSMLALSAVLFSACSQEDDFVAVNGEATVAFKVSAPEIATRAYSDGLSATVLQYAVYDSLGNILPDLTKSVANQNAEEIHGSKTVELKLTTGNKYSVIFWAAAPNAPYSVDLDAKTMTVNYEAAKTLCNAENRDAFFKCDTFVVNGSQEKTIELRRPFAQLNIGTNDYAKSTDAGYVPTQSYVNVNSIYTTLNLGDGTVEGDTTVTFGYNDIEKGETFPVTGYEYLAMNYLLVDADKELVEVEFGYTDGTVAKTRTVGSVPVQRNYRTNIYGQLLTSDVDINVEIVPEYKEPAHIVASVLPEVIELDNEVIFLKDINADYGTTVKGKGTIVMEKVTIKNANGAAVTLESGADITIQILGEVTLTGSTKGIDVQSGAVLVIDGAGNITTRAAAVERQGKLTIVGEAGSGIAVGETAVTINNIASLTAKGNGTHAYGIGGALATVKINNTVVDYVCGGHIQPLCVNDPKYGKSEPEGGAAIGGLNINIGSSVITKADGGSKAAAIGAVFHQSTNIVITNSTIKEANGGNASAGIGGSRYSGDISEENKQAVRIRIEKSAVTAQGGQFGAGIGAGYDTHCKANDTNAVNDIVIINSEINATGGLHAAGIGTGYHSAALTGSIDKASKVTAVAGESREKYTIAQNIGYGVVDVTREFKDADVTFTVAAKVIETPASYSYIAYVANIEEFQAALDAVKEGDNCIVFTADITGNATAVQAEDVRILVDGCGKNLNGEILVNGKSKAYETAALTVKNVNFTAATDGVSIHLGMSGDNDTRYTSNVTVDGCTFTGTDKTAAAVKSYTGGDKNLTITNCTAAGLHSFTQLKNVDGVNISGCTINEGKNGFSLGCSQNILFSGNKINSAAYGVRLDGTKDNEVSVKMTDCEIKAYIPVSVRKMNNDACVLNLAFKGNNKLTREGKYHVAVCSNEYEEGVAPVAPKGIYNLTGCDNMVVYTEDKIVAKVGNTEYDNIDDAIANWTNNTTLTLLANVALKEVVKIKSTEHHILNLSTFTMTAASGQHAIEITPEGAGTAARSCLTINADATNPGGINANNKSCIYYRKTNGINDRLMVTINGGIFDGSISSSSNNGGQACPYFVFNGGVFNGSISLTKAMLKVTGGIFHKMFSCTGDSTAYRLISGGTFKSWTFMTADAANKFVVGTAKGVYDVGVYVNKDGYLVVGGPVITELGDRFTEKKAYSSWSSFLKYSSAADNGLYYE